MNQVALAAASLAAVLHVGFFLLESVLWTKPIGRKVFRTTEAEAETVKFMAFNQGFYNLFLAIGAGAGVALAATGRAEIGRTAMAFACACMLGASLVLATGGKKYVRGVVMQGVPPAVALVALFV